MSDYFRTYECPQCQYPDIDVNVGTSQKHVVCPDCKSVLRVDYDGETDEYGQAHDLTKLTYIKRYVNRH